MAEGDSSWMDYNTDEDPLIPFLRAFGIEIGVEKCKVQQGEDEAALEGEPVIVQHNKDSWSETVNSETSTETPAASMSSPAPITGLPGDSQDCSISASPSTITWSREDNGLLVCHLCNYSTTYLGSQIRHSHTHTGERPFSCDLCQQSFRRRHHLERHTLTHTGERPYVCTICRAAFSTKGSCDRHMQLHPEERP